MVISQYLLHDLQQDVGIILTNQVMISSERHIAVHFFKFNFSGTTSQVPACSIIPDG